MCAYTLYIFYNLAFNKFQKNRIKQYTINQHQLTCEYEKNNWLTFFIIT
jgi:hypothetical protein